MRVISRKIGVIAACAALMAAVAGCRDGATGPGDDDQLDAAEGQALAVAISELTFDPALVSGTDDGTRKEHACPQGGTYAAAVEPGRTSESGDTTRLATTITIEPKGCMVSSGSGQLTLDGNPNLRTEVEATLVGLFESLSVVARTTGGVRWKLGDRSGTCAMELTATTDLSSTKTKVAGKLCGRNAEFEMDSGPSSWIDL